MGSADLRETNPEMFVPSPYLDDRINHNIIQSEIDGGIFLRDLPPGKALAVTTLNHTYVLECRESGDVLISGHERFCPEPVLVRIAGSTWGGSMLKTHFVGRSMHMEFIHPQFGVIRTSLVQAIEELPKAA
jgi:hypothetical protein